MDLYVCQNAQRRHFHILADRAGTPAAQLFQGAVRYHKARSVDHSGQAQSSFSPVIKPIHHPIIDRAAPGYGAVIGIFAVAIALSRPGPAAVCVIHLLKELRMYHIVRVKYTIGVISPVAQTAVSKTQYLPLTGYGDGTFQHPGAGIPRCLGRVVGAVIRNHPDVI